MTTSYLKKPQKKSDRELFQLINEKIAKAQYLFVKHAKQRLQGRRINDLDVLNILEGKIGYKRKRHKRKDKYEAGRDDWNYCIEGCDMDGNKMRIIISFEKNLMPIITVMWIN